MMASSWFTAGKLVAALAYVLASLWTNPCLSIEASSSTSASLLTTTNVLRQRPPLPSDSFDTITSSVQQEENHYYFRNTYDPYIPNDPITLESRSNSQIPWGNINIVVLTDVHSWIAGRNHRDDPKHWPYDVHRTKNQNADYGDVLSFYQRLRELVEKHNLHHPDANQRDLFFVMNGDFVDGTGLSEYPPSHLAPLLSHMPWDAVNVGNHELYHDETIHYITNNHFEQGSYLSSNTRLTTTAANHRTNSDSTSSSNNANIHPMAGQNYLYLQGHHTNTTILTFGFLYDFDENSPATKSKSVEEVIREKWFKDVLGQDNFDAILVLAHMDCLDPLVKILLKAIREALPPNRQSSMPIQFVTGHTHRRCHAKLDPNSESFEAGRFLDTIGFISWDSMDLNEEKNNTDNNFQHRFWDVTKESLHTTLAQETETTNSKSLTTKQKKYEENDFDRDFGTHEGRALSQAIRNTQTLLGLDETLGCSPNTYGIFQSNPHQKHDMSSTSPSLFHLYLSQMLPSQLLAPIWEGHHNDEQEQHFEANIGEPVFVAGSGSLRYTLFAGPVTVNDLIAIDPFNNSIFELVATTANNSSIAAAQEQEQQPIYGHELQEWLEAANNLYAQVAEYGMPTFVLSTLPSSDLTSAAAAAAAPTTTVNNIDPTKVYRIFATDYDASRLLSVVAVFKESKHSFAQENRAVYQSQPFCPDSKDKGNDQAACVFLTELWKDYIRKHMPCTSEGQQEEAHDEKPFSFGSYPISLSAQLFPESATTARIQSRRTAPHDATSAPLANDQKAALVVVFLALAMILYMLVYPPQATENDVGVSNNNTQRNRHSFSFAEGSLDNDDNELLEGGTMDVQLIPLCRLDTGNLSNDSSYGSI